MSKKNLYFFVLVLIISQLVNGCATMTKVVNGINTTLESINSLQNGKYPWEDSGSPPPPLPNNSRGIDGTKLSVRPSKKGDPYQCWACKGKGYSVDAWGKKILCTYCNGKGWRIY